MMLHQLDQVQVEILQAVVRAVNEYASTTRGAHLLGARASIERVNRVVRITTELDGKPALLEIYAAWRKPFTGGASGEENAKP